MTDELPSHTNQPEGDMARTSEPVTVEWVGGTGVTQEVHVDPYAGKITVNGREFELNAILDCDVPEWMYREVDTEVGGDV